MAQLVQTLIPILFLLATTARSQSTSFGYDFFGGDEPTDLLKQGQAHYPSEVSALRLTNPEQNVVGRAVHSEAIHFSQDDGSQVDFETTITFQINPSSNILAADGIAFFIGPVGTGIPNGATGRNLGVFGDDTSKTKVFAVGFSTYVNGKNPDPEYPSIGINIGTAKSINKTVVGDAIIGGRVTARIGYTAKTKKIRVRATANSQMFEVTYVYDLSKLLDHDVQVGLSASTGATFASHDIVSWYFNAFMEPAAVIKQCVM